MGNPDTDYVLRQVERRNEEDFWQECPLPQCDHEAYLSYLGNCAVHPNVEMVPQKY